MDFYKLIKSLDLLVFEVLSWLLYYPLTLFRLLVRPIETMVKAESELAEDEEHSFDDMLAPPMFLAITLGLLHLGELAEGVATTQGSGPMASFLADDKNLLAFRIIIFGMLPLIAAIRTLRHRGQPLEKGYLRAPVYAQCYAAAIFAILFSGTLLVANLVTEDKRAMFALVGFLLSIIWLGWVEARWFHRTLGVTRLRALGYTARVLLTWLLVSTLIAMIFV